MVRLPTPSKRDMQPCETKPDHVCWQTTIDTRIKELKGVESIVLHYVISRTSLIYIRIHYIGTTKVLCSYPKAVSDSDLSLILILYSWVSQDRIHYHLLSLWNQHFQHPTRIKRMQLSKILLPHYILVVSTSIHYSSRSTGSTRKLEYLLWRDNTLVPVFTSRSTNFVLAAFTFNELK